MDDLVDAIHAAVAPDATSEARAAGVAACRTMLGLLEAQPGQPLLPAPAAVPPELAGMLHALRSVPPDQLLELAIDKLRALEAARGTRHAGAHVRPGGISFRMVPIPAGAK